MHTNRPGLSNSRRQRVQLAPERARDLEVVALVAHHVEEGLVAAELEIVARRVGAERLVRLAVRVAPEVHERACPSRTTRSGLERHSSSPVSSSTRMTTSPGSATRKPSATAANAARREAQRRRQPGDRLAVGYEPQRAIDQVRTDCPTCRRP